MHSKEQYINQCLAEIAILRVFGLPKPKEDFTGDSFLSPYGIHALLHGKSGVPQEGKAGDLFVICEVNEATLLIHSVAQLTDNGSFKPFIEKPGWVDVPTRIAKFLATRSSEAA